ncbi:MAG TPA: hypothetical protein VEO18_05460 [Thermoplasmata archaeon]|nr:hypothetical protein [Thermoplasmata archaeon]
MRFPIPSLPGAAVLVALGIVVATAGIIALANGPVPNVRVTVSVPSDGRLPSGGLTSLLVTLSPSTAAEPRFFIVEGPIVYAWNTTGVTASNGSGTATYRISAPCSDCPIPAGTIFIVRVYDVLSRSYSFSPTMRA